MPLLTWKDLCVDALDVEAQSEFWAAVTGLGRVGPADHRRLEGATPAQTVWVNEVDRPHLVKNRVHLDVDAASLEDLVALGARVLRPAEDTGFAWSVLADPEGNEFCAFVRAPERLTEHRLHGIGIDATDPAALARWWGDAFGVEPTHDPADDWWTLEGVVPGERTTLDFALVPEPRSVPNRVHWDVEGRVDDVLAAGATRLWDTDHWAVLADPEGNEFCVFAPPGG